MARLLEPPGSIMNWLNIKTELVQSEDFLHSSSEQIGRWLQLMCYCATQENGGTIRGARHWAPATWIRITGSDTPGDSPLWHWHDEHLVVHHYDREKEIEIRRKRAGAKKTNSVRWSRKPDTENQSI